LTRRSIIRTNKARAYGHMSFLLLPSGRRYGDAKDWHQRGNAPVYSGLSAGQHVRVDGAPAPTRAQRIAPSLLPLRSRLPTCGRSALGPGTLFGRGSLRPAATARPRLRGLHASGSGTDGSGGRDPPCIHRRRLGSTDIGSRPTRSPTRLHAPVACPSGGGLLNPSDTRIHPGVRACARLELVMSSVP
jgi:hypothetical protein